MKRGIIEVESLQLQGQQVGKSLKLQPLQSETTINYVEKQVDMHECSSHTKFCFLGISLENNMNL